MKLLKITFLGLFILLYSCAQEPTEINNDVTLDFSKAKFEIKPNNTLLKYESLKELDSQISSQVTLVFNETQKIIKSNKEVTHIFLTLTASNGSFVISDVVEHNSKVGSYTDWGNYGAGSCPDDYTSLVSCYHNSNETACLAGLVSGFMSDNLDSIGDCAQVRISVGVIKTRVCGITC